MPNIITLCYIGVGKFSMEAWGSSVLSADIEVFLRGPHLAFDGTHPDMSYRRFDGYRQHAWCRQISISPHRHSNYIVRSTQRARHNKNSVLSLANLSLSPICHYLLGQMIGAKSGLVYAKPGTPTSSRFQPHLRSFSSTRNGLPMGTLWHSKPIST